MVTQPIVLRPTILRTENMMRGLRCIAFASTELTARTARPVCPTIGTGHGEGLPRNKPMSASVSSFTYFHLLLLLPCLTQTYCPIVAIIVGKIKGDMRLQCCQTWVSFQRPHGWPLSCKSPPWLWHNNEDHRRDQGTTICSELSRDHGLLDHVINPILCNNVIMDHPQHYSEML